LGRACTSLAAGTDILKTDRTDDDQSDEHSENDNNDSIENEYDCSYHQFQVKISMTTSIYAIEEVKAAVG
jgi:hypothetical protein